MIHIRNMLPPGTTPKHDQALRQAANLLNYFSQEFIHLVMDPLAQRYIRRGVRNMLPPGTTPKDDRALRQATNLLNYFSQEFIHLVMDPLATGVAVHLQGCQRYVAAGHSAQR